LKHSLNILLACLKQGANAGLGVAREALEPIKAKFPNISYADLYTYAGVVAIEEAGGPKIPYQTGRIDMEDGSTSPPDGRLPDADKGARTKTIQHVRDIFYRMGFNDQEIVALLGAHAMGRCHTDRSGYWCVLFLSFRAPRFDFSLTRSVYSFVPQSCFQF